MIPSKKRSQQTIWQQLTILATLDSGSRMLSIIIMPQLCCPLYYANDVSSTQLTFDGCHQLCIINQPKWFNCFIFSLHHSHFKSMHQSGWVTSQDSCINFPTHTVESKQQFRNINSLLIFLSQNQISLRKICWKLFKMLFECFMFYIQQAKTAGCNRNVIGWSFLKQAARFLSVRVSSFGKSETSDAWEPRSQFRPIYINLLQSNKSRIFLAFGTGCSLFLWLFIRPSSSQLQCGSEEMAMFHPRFDPLQKFTMFVFLVTRCIKLLSAEGADIIYRDAASEWDTEMQSSFNNIGSPSRCGSKDQIWVLISPWDESIVMRILTWPHTSLIAILQQHSNHDDDMVAADLMLLALGLIPYICEPMNGAISILNLGLHLKYM